MAGYTHRIIFKFRDTAQLTIDDVYALFTEGLLRGFASLHIDVDQPAYTTVKKEHGSALESFHREIYVLEPDAYSFDTWMEVSDSGSVKYFCFTDITSPAAQLFRDEKMEFFNEVIAAFNEKDLLEMMVWFSDGLGGDSLAEVFETRLESQSDYLVHWNFSNTD